MTSEYPHRWHHGMSIVSFEVNLIFFFFRGTLVTNCYVWSFIVIIVIIVIIVVVPFSFTTGITINDKYKPSIITSSISSSSKLYLSLPAQLDDITILINLLSFNHSLWRRLFLIIHIYRHSFITFFSSLRKIVHNSCVYIVLIRNIVIYFYLFFLFVCVWGGGGEWN